MLLAKVNGVQLFYELSGTGEIPLVLVHGSWVSHHDWDLVVPTVAESYRVLSYDRRGHSESQRSSQQGSVREDVADLAALIEHLDLAPAWVIGNSFGGSITLRLAAERPDLLRGIIVHEPPLFELLIDDPAAAPMLKEVGSRISTLIERIVSGEHRGAAEYFVEEVALGPGRWAQLTLEARKTMIENAPTFLDEARDPESLTFDPGWLKAFSRPALLTKGDQSPSIFAPVIERLTAALPNAECVRLTGSGHIPHVTDPDAYIEVILDFIRNRERAPR